MRRIFLEKSFLIAGGGASNLLHALYINLRLELNPHTDFSKLKELFKIFHKDFLFKEFNPNDANTLNDAFYKELLYILGLKEQKISSALLITKSEESNTQGTLYKGISDKLKNVEFESILSLIILWLNRILFLKLIEAKLISFNTKEKEASLKFLSYEKIGSFKKLSYLFFEVLAKPYEHRQEHKDFQALPYLNSSLFSKKDIENVLDISALDDDLELNFFEHTQIKDKYCNKKQGKTKLLEYLFAFLDSFDFGSYGEENTLIKQKELINSSVLGAVFEKLNGYKEGSFYTPSFITNYMCKESLEKIVLEKFNTAFKFEAKNLESLKLELREKRRDLKLEELSKFKEQCKALLVSIRICDPAVGSGHFLVSALVSMIKIYDELSLFTQDFYTKSNQDELQVLSLNGEFIEYKKPKSLENNKAQLIQEELFNLKKSIIENNLFGVDINPNSCEITKLRLWIELLKHSFYLDTQSAFENLQTLPNIDINIKCGNSLISYFDTQTSLSHYPNIKERINEYKKAVANYKEGFYADKTQIDNQIKTLHQAFKTFCLKDKFKTQIKAFEAKCDKYSSKYGNFLAKDDKDLMFYVASRMFIDTFDEQEAQKAFDELKKEYANIFNLESNKPFEWRFAFPEVLDSNGDFLGFDLIIGNPPYIRQQEITHYKEQLKQKYKLFNGGADIYIYFFELAFNLLRTNARFSFITSNKWVKADYGKTLQEFLLKKAYIETYIDFEEVKVFDSANVDVSIIQVANYSKDKSLIQCSKISQAQIDSKVDLCTIINENHFLKAQSSLNLNYFRFEIGDKSTDIFLKLQALPLKLTDIAQIAKGLSTGNDKVFLFESIKEHKDILEVQNEFGRFHIEKGILVPFCYGEDIKRLEYCKETKYLLYPYDDKNCLLEKKTLREIYPCSFKYLETMQEVLMQRKIDTNEENFYKFSALRNAHTYKNSKVMIPDLLNFARFGFDKIGLFHNAGIHNVALKKEYIGLEKLILGILNSKLFWFFINKSSTKLGGSALRLMPIYINPFSFPKITKTNQKIVNEIIALVDEILDSKAKDPALNTHELESQIDFLVYQLYNLTNKEIELIENK